MPKPGLGDAPTPGGRGCLGRAVLFVVCAPLVAFALVCLPHCGERDLTTTPPVAPAPAPSPAGPSLAADVARSMERLLLEAAPRMRPYLSMVDVDAGDRHLIVHFKPDYARLTAEDRRVVEPAIADVWRQTVWVRERGWSPAVEFIEYRPASEARGDGTDSWSHFNRAGR